MIIKKLTAPVAPITEEVEVELPYHFVDNGNYYRINEGNTIHKIMNTGSFFGITLCDMKVHTNEIAKGREISKDEFDRRWFTTLNELLPKPKEVEAEAAVL